MSLRHIGRWSITLALVAVAASCSFEAPPVETSLSPTQAPSVPASAAVDPSAAADAATFGGWRRGPITPTPEFTSTVEAACRAQPSIADLPLAVLDVRGEGRATLVFAAAGPAVECRADVAPDGTATVQVVPIAAADGATPPPTGKLGVYDLARVDDVARPYSVLVGEVGDQVHSVGVNFDADAAWYKASQANGWYAIWWPGATKPIAVAASDMRSVVMDGFTP
jgi:hypothetical protein